MGLLVQIYITIYMGIILCLELRQINMSNIIHIVFVSSILQKNIFLLFGTSYFKHYTAEFVFVFLQTSQVLLMQW